IDEVILRLLALEPNEIDELDYETYRSYLKELLVEITSGRKIDSGEASQVTEEYKRIKSKKGRFKISSKKSKITAEKLGLGEIRKTLKGTQKRLMLSPVGGVPKQVQQPELKKKETDTGTLVSINKTLDSILSTLTTINSQNKSRIEKERRDAESKRRTGREKELESRPIEGIKKVISAVTKPFQSIWDKIVNFITNIILGRIVLKLIDWIADPKNQGKIQTIIRFFKDNWPLLLTLYLRFGTGIGRFIGKLTGILIKGSLKLIQVTANLAARMGLKGAGRLGKFLGGRGGRLLGAGLTIGANVAGMMGASSTIEGFTGGETKVPGFSGGGWSGGIKNFFGNMFSGLVKGPKGRDKVPAMLTDGEFVMSAGAVRKYGVDTLESMNASGGGTNVPQIVDGVTHAAGGGFINFSGREINPYNPSQMNEDDFSKWVDGRIQERLTNRRLGLESSSPKPNPRITKINPSRMLPSAGQSSANAMRAAQRTARVTRAPIPASRAIVPYSGGGLVRTGVTAGLSESIPQIRTNMNVPGGIRGGRGGLVGAILTTLAEIFKPQLQSGMGSLYNKMGVGMGNLSNVQLKKEIEKELKLERSISGGPARFAMGENERLMLLQKESERRGLSGLKGGKIVGGYGLREQSFKDAPKTQVMSDDKGRPFVGYKAMRGGKLVYIRGPQPGQGTTNPFEALGRMINPGAYKENDARLQQKKYEEASRSSISSLRERGASQATIARRQAELKKGVKPLPRSKSKPYVAAGGGMGGRRGSGANPSRSGSKPPSMPATHRKGTMTSASAYGIMR
ncbi:MAG: hypothetical protein ACO3EY_06595, partial [Candidatus Nanopelagicales bacterium]